MAKNHNKPAAASHARGDEQARYSAPALDKGLDILELLADEPDGATQSEIARRLDRSISEIFRMLMTLERRGYVVQLQPGQRYSLSLKLFELSHRHPPMRRLLTKALPLMEFVAAETRQSCHLAIIRDGRLMVIAHVDNPDRFGGFAVREGAIEDIFRASSGFVILAHQSAERQRQILDAWRSLNRRSRLPRNLTAHLKRIRALGYEETVSYRTRGVINVSFPIIDASGAAIAAMTVPFLEEIGSRITDAHVRAALARVAARLSRELGGSGARA